MKTTPATLKALSALGLVGVLIGIAPLDNKILLLGILLIPLGTLYLKIKESNDFLVRSSIPRTWKEAFSHPWVTVLIVLMLWAVGHGR